MPNGQGRGVGPGTEVLRHFQLLLLRNNLEHEGQASNKADHRHQPGRAVVPPDEFVDRGKAVLLGGELEVRALRALVVGPEPGSCLIGVGIVVPDGYFHQAGVQRGMGGPGDRLLDPPYPLLQLSGRAGHPGRTG